MKFLDILTENDSQRNFQKAKAIFLGLKTGEVTIHLDSGVIYNLYNIENAKPVNQRYKYDLGHEFKIDTYWDHTILKPGEFEAFHHCNIKIFVPRENIKLKL